MNDELRSALLRTLPFLIVVCVVGILIKRKKVRPDEIDFTRPDSTKFYFVWVIGFLAFTLLIEAMLSSLNLLEVSKWKHSPIPSIILIVGAVVLAPIAEEILFRGFILNLLKKCGLNNTVAICAQSFIFVFLHNFAYENTVSSNIGILQSFVDGVLYGYARQTTRSLYTPMTMHITGNAIATLERFLI